VSATACLYAARSAAPAWGHHVVATERLSVAGFSGGVPIETHRGRGRKTAVVTVGGTDGSVAVDAVTGNAPSVVRARPSRRRTLTTGGTIAHYVTCGADVRVVTCTLGEEGEVIGDQHAQLAVDAADQLGGYRIGELTSALNALGIEQPIFLGGAGRWRDSGMAGTSPRRRQRFVDADMREAVGELVKMIRQLRPHVVVTYDANGGYGHPDHIHAHDVTMAAVAASGGSEYPGEPWTVPKLLLDRDVDVCHGGGARRARGRAAGMGPGIDR